MRRCRPLACNALFAAVPARQTSIYADLEMHLQVAHYPPGCSKYNPIEHRLFCHVSRAISAVVLKTIDVAKEFIARTHTALG